jgi:hypothetical protein
MPRRFHCAFVLLIVLAIAIPIQAGQKQPGYYLKQDQTVDLPSETKLITAKQSCENWGLAAGIETILHQQNVPLNQNFWVMRLSGGELCLSDLPSMEALAHTVNNEFVLDDGRHVRLETRFVAGPPVNIDAVITSLRQQQVSLLIWRGHPYYLTGITYDEHIGGNGSRLFEVKELRLANTFSNLPGAAFEKDRDDPNEIQGILSVGVNQ